MGKHLNKHFSKKKRLKSGQKNKKDPLYHKLLGKFRPKEQWDTTSHP